MTSSGPDEAQLVSRLRRLTAGVITALLVVYIAGGIFELPFLRSTFQVDPTILGILIGSLLLLLGVEGLNRIPGIGSK